MCYPLVLAANLSIGWQHVGGRGGGGCGVVGVSCLTLLKGLSSHFVATPIKPAASCVKFADCEDCHGDTSTANNDQENIFAKFYCSNIPL